MASRRWLLGVCLALALLRGSRAGSAVASNAVQPGLPVLALGIGDRLATCSFKNLTGTFLLEQLWQYVQTLKRCRLTQKHTHTPVPSRP
jgi:hypothetical protein